MTKLCNWKTIRLGVVSAVCAAMVFASGGVWADTVWLKGSDGSGSSSMTGAGTPAGWSNGAKAAQSGVAYGIKDGYALRTVEDGDNYTFPGSSLELLGGTIAMKLKADKTLTIPRLIVTEKGSINLWSNNRTCTLAGSDWEIREGAALSMNSYNESATGIRNLVLAATVSGKGLLNLYGSGSLTSGDQFVKVGGNMSSFTGRLAAYNKGSSAFTAWFTSTSQWLGNPTALDAASVTVTNNAILRFDTDVTSSPNRGFFFGDATDVPGKIYVAAGKKVKINGPVTGARGFEKLGGGTLELYGSTRGLDTDQVVVTAGDVVYATDITISSSLGSKYGTVSPAYGVVSEPVSGQEYVFTCTQTEQSLAEGRSKAICTGWKLNRLSDGGLIKSSADAGEEPYVCRHTYAQGVGVNLQWQWVIRHKVKAAAGEGGSVDVAEQWVFDGASATVRATSAEGMKFVTWAGDVTSTESVLTVGSVTKPLALTAVFCPADATVVPPSDDDHTRITNAIAQAAAGGIVQLLSGTYRLTRQISIARDVTLRGSSRTGTILDFQQKSRGFSLSNAGATVRDLTICNSYVDGYGGGVNMSNGLVSNCLVKACTVNGYNYGGGGIYMADGKVLDCEITKCKFNTLYGQANAIWLKGGTVSGCDIYANDGGYTHSDASYGSHAVRVEGGTLKYSKIRNNSTHLAGIKQTSGTVANCLVVGNTSDKNAAGIYKTNGNTYYCTFSRNVKEGDVTGCSGIWQSGGTTMYCISYGNGPSTSTAGSNQISGGTFKSNVVDKALGSYAVNKAVDPVFANAAGGDYHIASRASSAYRYGRYLTSYPKDLDGLARDTEAPTAGCYEYDLSKEKFSAGIEFAQSDYRYGSDVTVNAVVEGAGPEDVTYAWTLDGQLLVDETEPTLTVRNLSLGRHTFKISLTRKTGGVPAEKEYRDYVAVRPDDCYVNRWGNGTYPFATPETATNSIQAAVAAVWTEKALTTTVHVAEGSYTNTANIALQAPIRIVGAGKRKTYVRYAGGRAFSLSHAGAEICDLCVRNSAYGFSVSSGRIHDCRAEDNSTSATSSIGSGFAVSGSGKVWNCEAVACASSGIYGGGGGLHMSGGSVSNMLIVGCTGYDSYDHSDGGAVVAKGGGTLTDVTVCGTSMSSVKGSAVNASGVTMNRCVVSNCTSTGSHAVYLVNTTARNCLFAKNSGGVTDCAPVYVSGGTYDNCTFAENRNKTCCLTATGVVAYNTIFAECGGKNVLSGTIRNCLAPSLVGGENGNIAGSPKFRSTARGDFRLFGSSPGVNAGDNARWASYVKPTDLAGSERILDRVVDMGCYERRPTGMAIVVR